MYLKMFVSFDIIEQNKRVVEKYPYFGNCHMFELPEYTVLSSQINETLKGKAVISAVLGNSPHKFVWYNLSCEEFSKKMRGKTIGESYSRGRWLFIKILPGYILVLGECGGKILYHRKGYKKPSEYHLFIDFKDGTAFSVTTRMWGAMELYKEGKEKERQYIKDMRPTPVDKNFTQEYFLSLVEECLDTDVKTVKAILTQNQLIPGLGNSIAQDIMFNAGFGPKFPLKKLADKDMKTLYDAIIKTVSEVIKKKGRYDEFDLFGELGKYKRKMDKNSTGKPCPRCGIRIEKIQYLGGACYYCPGCQRQ